MQGFGQPRLAVDKGLTGAIASDDNATGQNPVGRDTLDFRGYNFWLSKPNQFNGDYVSAEMVKAFPESDEYRKRFGP
ncbi:MAG: hypothetical protein JOZ02_04230 [Acidobacteria bacterium]|nr:hypothetical protein [Acidobacteriota bacterium]